MVLQLIMGILNLVYPKDLYLDCSCSFDLEENIKSQIKFFVDDAMIFSIVKDIKISANDLNQDLETIQHWANQWKTKFIPDPTKQATEFFFR